MKGCLLPRSASFFSICVPFLQRRDNRKNRFAFVGWNFLGTFKLASAGPFVASFSPRMGFRFYFARICVVSDQFCCIWSVMSALGVVSGSIAFPPFDEAFQFKIVSI
jgi:hypothetical protein